MLISTILDQFSNFQGSTITLDSGIVGAGGGGGGTINQVGLRNSNASGGVNIMSTHD